MALIMPLVCALWVVLNAPPPSTTPPPPPATPPAAPPAKAPDEQELADNPEYASWARFKPGTQIGSTTVRGVDRTVFARGSSKLLEITPEQAVVELTISTFVDGKEETSPPRQVTIPARVPKARVGPPKFDTSGQEEFTIGDRTIKATWYRSEVKNPRGEVVLIRQRWESDDVPGRIVKTLTQTMGARAVISETQLTILQPAP